jgi:hypothetical protein
VVLADRIKRVRDSHLLELIQDVIRGTTSSTDVAGSSARKFPPAAATLPFPRAAAAAAGGNGNSNSNDPRSAHVSGGAGQAQVSIPFTDHHSDHHSEQEDYLWGV